MICKSPALLSLALFALLASPAPAQSPDAAPHFLAADVHPSPHSMYPRSRWTLGNGRYFMRQASIVDLIVDAYAVDPDNVAGGPPWLDTSRFDIYASVPPKTSRQSVRLMLRALLADRFQLVLTSTQKPMPAYVLSVGKGTPKMTAADAAEPDSGCRYIDPGPAPAGSTVAPLYTFSCRNVTMETFAQNLHDWGGDYIHTPVVDSTGLKGGWDFDFKFHSQERAARSGADGVTIFAAVDKQLGLKLEAKTAPLPVVLVTNVRETPTPNAPDLAKVLPSPPPAEFDVATIRPSRPDETAMRGGIHGGAVDLEAGTPEFMITFAYEITPDMLVDAPKWLSTDHYDIVGKAAIDPTPGAQQIELEDLQMMMRKFLAERFNLKVHTEDRPLDAFTLLAAGPRLKKADPSERTGCKEGPGADGKDPRIATPILGRLMTCRNMTMAQFVDQLPAEAGGYVRTPVLDATGLDGAYDFTLSFSSAGQLQSKPSGPSPTGDTSAAASASDPNGALSLQDALARQLGLKLVKQKRPVAVLVIDHIDRTPTEN